MIVPPKTKKERSWQPWQRPLEEAMKVAAECASTGDWDNTGPEHLVALFAIMHERVYGIAPNEIAVSWAAACKYAGAVLQREFAGSMDAAAEYLDWRWSRVRAQEKRRKANGLGTQYRLGWRFLFSPDSLMDWRVTRKIE
jgi:hypothetical protein